MEIEMKCIMGELNHPNHNGRIYDSKMMQEAIDKWKESGNKMVELNPNYGNIEYFSVSKLENVVGQIEDVWIENNEIFGKVQLFDTPKGKCVKQIIQNGHNMNIGPRMIGDKVPVLNDEGQPTYDKNGNQIFEVKDVEVVSFDIV